jgi:predicted nucleic acid-binding protein
MAKALRLRDEYQRQIHRLIAPAHFPLEVANGLTKAERQKIIPVGDATLLIRDILNTSPILYIVDTLFYRAVEISSQTRSAFYDCLYVALAERERCELVTADLQLVNNLQAHFPFVLSLASLPC